jgi:enoyl-CoA hydratase/carnithine racemase
MAFPETKSMGIIPGLGGTYRLPQIVARNQALELILTNRTIKVGKATYLGLGESLVVIQSDPANNGKAHTSPPGGKRKNHSTLTKLANMKHVWHEH